MPFRRGAISTRQTVPLLDLNPLRYEDHEPNVGATLDLGVPFPKGRQDQGIPLLLDRTTHVVPRRSRGWLAG